MFKKLRNRFLVLNLIIISAIMLISFATIYLIMYKNIYDNINIHLQKIEESKEIKGKPRPNDSMDIPFNNEINPHSVSFTLILDKQLNIINTTTAFDIENEIYEKAKKEVISQKEETGIIDIEDSKWAFIIALDSYKYKITFIDVTSQLGILTNLIYTFLVIALFMFIFIYFISRFFANKSIKPIEETFYKQKQFIADASHELRTPLAVINTNVDALLTNGNDTINSQLKWLYYIKSESERMSKLTNDLLYLTQMDNSDQKMIFTNFNLSESVENVILVMEAVIFEHNISLKYNIEPNLVVRGNNDQIKQVVMILLDNALKYTNTNGSVNISLQKHNNKIRLTILNTGQGIHEKYLGKIFDRFYRTDKSRTRKSGGYGLGLAIAKAIIDQHKGKIYAKSIIDQNTTIFIELPLFTK
jgi:two-component system, OmpR family, sensor histidine kinase CiaH